MIFQIILVDKAVLVNRAALAQPTDVFVRSGPARQHGNTTSSTTTTGMMSRTTVQRPSGSCPRMDSICEGSDEGSSSSSEGETGSTFGSLSSRGRFPPVMRPGLPAQYRTENMRQLQINGKPVFVHGPQHKVKSGLPETYTGRDVDFTAENNCNCVEAGTNTSSVELHDKSTSTDGLGNAVVDGKMAECINKLRTVRQRLEQQQPLTPRNTSPPDSTPTTPPQPINDDCSPPRIQSPTPPPSEVTLPPTGSGTKSVSSTDDVEQPCDQEDEVRQFISELKSRTLQETSSESKRLVHSVPGRRFVIDRKRAGNLSGLDHVPGSPTSSPRPRRSNPPDGATSRPLPSQRSYSPRAIARNVTVAGNGEGPAATAAVMQDMGSPTQMRSVAQDMGSPTLRRSVTQDMGSPTLRRAVTQDMGSPTLRRSVATTKKLPGISSSPAMRSGNRAIPTDPPTRPQSAKAQPTMPAGPSRSPGSSPRNFRSTRTSSGAAAAAQRLATIDDEQARSTSDSDSLMTNSGGSSDDQMQSSGAAKPPATPKLARKQRLEMTQLLLVKSDQPPPGVATGVKQVRGSPTTARRASNPRHN